MISRADILDIKEALKKLDEDKDDNRDPYLSAIWNALDSGGEEQLNQLLHQGPVWDGNVISKFHRDFLIEYGLATRCCYMGDDGYTAATYLGKAVFKMGRVPPMKIIAPAKS